MKQRPEPTRKTQRLPLAAPWRNWIYLDVPTIVDHNHLLLVFFLRFSYYVGPKPPTSVDSADLAET